MEVFGVELTKIKFLIANLESYLKREFINGDSARSDLEFVEGDTFYVVFDKDSLYVKILKDDSIVRSNDGKWNPILLADIYYVNPMNRDVFKDFTNEDLDILSTLKYKVNVDTLKAVAVEKGCCLVFYLDNVEDGVNNEVEESSVIAFEVEKPKLQFTQDEVDVLYTLVGHTVCNDVILSLLNKLETVTSNDPEHRVQSHSIGYNLNMENSVINEVEIIVNKLQRRD